ncbi:MAG TPA: NAD(P)-dependent alcohol dehydrogenase, partial [Elusimicrobiota bacterium]|nr:NAD(P)-dependent alcohol dehydrogenase [Elusimicrobiota bacterium]
PGHEIVGRVSRAGSGVKRFKTNDLAGIGCFVDSDRTCSFCQKGLQQYCDHVVWTYNSTERDGRTRTFGGYSSQIVVDENYALTIAAGQPLDRVAPLLCAGITTYSPLRRWKAGPGRQVGIIGLGGLGHMGVKLAAAMGAEVTVFSTSRSKEADARRLGAAHFILSSDSAGMSRLKERFDLLVSTISAPYDVNAFLALLKVDATMVMVGVPPKALALEAHNLILRRRQLAGSVIGGLPETQEMLDFCAAKKIAADVEVIPMAKVNEAYERMLKSDVRYRFVIDLKTL